jgi:DNA polymerase-1
MDSEGVLGVFKEYFEDDGVFKCWHNYSFDRAVMHNSGINVRGLGGDTMHMARLANPSRGPKEYSLGRLSHHYTAQIANVKGKLLDRLRLEYRAEPDVLAVLNNYADLGKTKPKASMEKLFAYNKVLKSGGLSKLKVMPTVHEMHTDPKYAETWVQYSVLDAELTYYLRECLVTELKSLPIGSEDMTNLWDFYLKYWLPFGELLTDMERRGV